MINKDYHEIATTAAGGDTRAIPPRSEENTGDIESAPVSFITSEYLTVDITNGKEPNLIEIKEAKEAPVTRPAVAGPVQPEIHNVGKDTKDFVNTEYLTVNVTNGKEKTLKELKKQFPRIKIFQLPHLVLFGNHISLYRLDRNFGVTK